MGAASRVCTSCDTPVPAEAALCPTCGAATPTQRQEAIPSDFQQQLTAALVDRYTIERELGRGGMAIVYLAEDVKHHRPVAIKVLQPELAAALGPDRFLREIEVTARLNHPHILPLLDSGEAAGLLFYVMPYVEGQSLRERLDEEKQLRLEEALRIAAEVADALSFAHGHDVLHRDIKPENILLEGGHAVVADFGLARAIHAAGGTRLTETGMAVGTPEYMSPEQAAGERELDARSDVYSLGCVLYEMLAGEPPFTGPTIESVARQHLTAAPPDVTTLRAAVPAQVSQRVMQALAKAPADRFHSAAEFGEAITPSSVITSSPLVGTVRTVRRRWAMVGGAVVLAVATIAVMATVLMPRGATGGLDPHRVLVVAFTDETGLEQTRALGRMVQDYIIQTLTEAGFAQVVDPLTALMTEQNVAAAGVATGPGDVLVLADDARAGTVVSGSYYTADDSLHIHTRITDARDGSLLGSVAPIVGSVAGRRELLARVGQAVTAALATVSDRELGLLEPAAPPANYDAYEAFVRAMELYHAGAFDEAAPYFVRAVAADSTFARARLWAAQSLFIPGRPADQATADSLLAPLVDVPDRLSGYDRCRLDFVLALREWSYAALYDAARCMVEAAPGSDDAKYELALAAVRINRPREGIRLFREFDPDRGLAKRAAYWSVLCNPYHMIGDYEAELAVARQGRERFPDNLDPGGLLGDEARALAALGRLDELAELTQAMLDSVEEPGHWLLWVARPLRAHGHRGHAAEVSEQAVAWFRTQTLQTARSRTQFAEALYLAGRLDEALAVTEQLAAESPQAIRPLAMRGILAARLGNRDEARRISDELRLCDRERCSGYNLTGGPTWRRARIAAALGDRDEAVRLLRQVLGVSFPYEHWVTEQFLEDEPLRDYPPFQELMRPKG